MRSAERRLGGMNRSYRPELENENSYLEHLIVISNLVSWPYEPESKHKKCTRQRWNLIS